MHTLHTYIAVITLSIVFSHIHTYRWYQHSNCGLFPSVLYIPHQSSHSYVCIYLSIYRHIPHAYIYTLHTYIQTHFTYIHTYIYTSHTYIAFIILSIVFSHILYIQMESMQQLWFIFHQFYTSQDTLLLLVVAHGCLGDLTKITMQSNL